MMRWLLFSCLLATTVLGEQFEEDVENAKNGTIWAVLVAGSNDWAYYRHQADICHAFQILHRHGVPDEHIIVFMYDDIAYNSENPNQGVVINKPSGKNLYPGVNKDYTGSDVTPANFLAAITGNSTAVNGKKVLKSGPNDHVFIYFTGRGGSGHLCFPDHDCTLYADDLNNALQTMHDNKMYKKLLFYLGAAQAGSMFEKLLPTDINVIATTSANPKESSYAVYCTEMVTCLGDEYGVAWMEQTDKAEKKLLKTETILKQFNAVVAKVHDSTPQMYGQLDMKTDLLTDYIGYNSSTLFENEPDTEPKNPVPSREVFLYHLNQRIKNTNDAEKLKELQERRTAYLQGRQVIDELFINIMSKAGASDEEINSYMTLNMEMFPCYKTLTKAFRDTCVDTNKNGYVVGHYYKLANLCLRDNFNAENALRIFSDECKEHHRQLSGIN